MRRLLPLLTCAALLLAGCSRRERANPFDPLNPATSGRPPGFTAVAGDHSVRLRWESVQGNSLLGYQLFRRGPTDTVFAPLTEELDLSVSTIRDFPLTNGTDYAYRLYFVFPFGLGSRPAEDVAAPGAAVPWVIEAGGTDLISVAPDDRRVASRFGDYTSTSDVAVNPASGAVWIADEGSGSVVVFQPAGSLRLSIPGLRRPRAVAVDAFDGSGWVCDVEQGLVFHFGVNGEQASVAIAPLVQPVDAAVDAEDGSVWICELGADRVSRHEYTQGFWQERWAASVQAPSRVAIDGETRDGWVTSFANGTVTKLSSVTGARLLSLTGFQSPLGVAVDAARGRIWIADPHAGSVVALDRDGNVEFRVAGLADAGEISVDAGTGEAWAVLGRSGELVRISPAGVLLRRLKAFHSPVAVSVDPGGR